MQHLMIDIETLGTGPDAVVMSIGAVEFSVDRGVGPKFYVDNLPIEDQLGYGRDIYPDTLRWWVDQIKNKGASTPTPLQVSRAPDTPIAEALTGLSAFVRHASPSLVWANAPTFDCTIIRSLAADYDVPVPWPFYNEACYRTWKRMAAASPDFAPVKPERAHNALSDAIAQAETMINNHAIIPF